MSLKSFLSRQARKPTGLFGRIVAPLIFNSKNRSMNLKMAEVVAPSDGNTILEIGFGTGTVVQQLASSLSSGMVEGIDLSEAMLESASHRNRKWIRHGLVRLRYGDFDDVNYSASSFDCICSSNTVYFWVDRLATLSKIYALLKPGGRLVLGFLDGSRMTEMPLDMGVFHPVSAAEMERELMEVGFSDIALHAVESGLPEYCIECVK